MINWDAVGAIGEIVGAIAVVISVAYLAIQIRAGSKTLSTNLRDSIFASVIQWNYQLAADPECVGMFHKGLRDFHSLDENERLRFMHYAFGLFKVFENIYLHYLEGSVGEEAWLQHQTLIHSYYTMPGDQYYLRARKAAFDKRFLEQLAGIETLGIDTPEIVAQGRSQ